ncbi:hypothetical protein GGH12_000391 [Coemansia sp. RSA 1822]|nr:hypothetical protein LPJ76_004589 [Coemansia sp. RSA 638]KAJ2124616.1 hypothetical protein IW147_001581 [Coemansia sp. RSA 720]KAJ2540415.1 hypothetical protein GGF49_004483 [Coemansia sp. RSA 1853]KAJ2567278.1 hypothetical protein GGH12_000391 [Coemansia sp. RSA 1822]
MDALLDFIADHEDSEIKVSILVQYLKAAHDTARDLIDENTYEQTVEYLKHVDALSYDDAMQLLDILIPQLATSMASKHQPGERSVSANFTGNIIDEVDNNVQTVPKSVFVPQPRTTAAPLDSLNRKRTSPVKRYRPTSMAEGSRLRGRNIAGMSNEEYDALASNIQPSLVNDIATYASQTGMVPSYTSHTVSNAASNVVAMEQTAADHPSLSDPEQSGFSTPRVSRRAVRQRMQIVRASPPGNGTYDIPISPDSSFRDPTSPGHDGLSSTRYGDVDDGSKKQIQELLSKKAELQKMVTEKERRLELIEDQYEKRTVALEQDLDECKAELTMKKRDIERLKLSEKSYVENLQIAEGEVERMGVSLSNSAAQSADLRRQLETKTTQITDANRRAMENQAEVSKLKRCLGTNQQQQDLLAREHRRLELQYQELNHELNAAREFKEEATEMQRENMRLGHTIESLNRELKELRLHQGTNTDQDAGSQRRTGRTLKSLQDELAQLDGGADLGVDDIIAVSNALAPATKSVSVGTTSADAQELKDAGVRQWIGAALGRCSSEDMVVLSEVWRRIEYCDANTTGQSDLRHELIEVFMAPYKYGLKEAIRSRSNATLTRIVDNVTGDHVGVRLSAGHQSGEKGSLTKGAPGLAQALANGQHTTAAIVLYSVVIFCLGIITASYFNIAQPLATSMPFGVVNSTGSAIHDSRDSSMSMMRQILVVDDTPVHKYYTPLRKRSPRSRFGEILFYWMETLLWDDADTQVPT